MSEQVVILWTARAALLLYAACLAGEWIGGAAFRRSGWARLAWTAGCLLAIAHVVAVYKLRFHWSHQAAWQHIADRTASVIGWPVGWGLYFNHLFLVVWSIDAGAAWLVPQRFAGASKATRLLVHGYLAFLGFCAAVVFAPGAARWVGLAVAIGLIILLASVRVPRRARRADGAMDWPAMPPAKSSNTTA